MPASRAIATDTPQTSLPSALDLSHRRGYARRPARRCRHRRRPRPESADRHQFGTDPAYAPHPGTLDLDLGLQLALFDDGGYADISTRLRAEGFGPDTNPRQPDTSAFAARGREARFSPATARTGHQPRGSSTSRRTLARSSCRVFPSRPTSKRGSSSTAYAHRRA